MSEVVTNRIGTEDHAEANPRKLFIWNGNYDASGRLVEDHWIKELNWLLEHGKQLLGEFPSYEAAAARARELTAK